jgi:type I restriction-modification system DNA methylase subunit/restriction endonuclease S subunit
MNGEIKKHIDAARQVLVGVVPNPSSQIDQITYALIYKFMDDMDQAAIKSGDKPSFFVDDLEEYSWARLMDSKLGNQEKMNLYVLAFQKFAEAKQLPELFRNILKSAFLPYRSPETLGLFLKEINYFDYSHPEELGNAYEYLLSIMSSQGDAGQFRTPRHIIDFIVNVVNPTKDDKILDPACGTGGFLISSYKHILEQHDGKDDPEGKEKPLTPDERRKLMNNLEGYDIDPGMVRIAQVNMYLHQFKDPKIFQYDTLSNDERWSDKFDVILANPPFMSPKGGITPHNKFSVSSNRSEVLFVDYIMNHLRPKGRAGIIVPEGIIFQSGNAYKELRKNLVNDGLCAVVSLPSGIFNPYSGVKTSILFFDNSIKKATDILFIKIENDGFDLGAQRRQIEKNDLPRALDIINRYRKSFNNKSIYLKGKDVHDGFAQLVEKKEIIQNENYNLSGERYKKEPLVVLQHFLDDTQRQVELYSKALEPMKKMTEEYANTMKNLSQSAKDIQKMIDSPFFKDYTKDVQRTIESMQKAFDENNFKQVIDSAKFIKEQQINRYPIVELGKFIKEVKERANSNNLEIWSISNELGFLPVKEYFDKKISSKDTKNYKIVYPLNFAYNPSRINVGSIALNESDKKGIVSPMYVVFELIDKYKLDDNFLFYLLKSKKIIEKVKNLSQGAVRQQLKYNDLSKIRIPLPSKEDQKKIVSKIKKYEKIVIGANQIIDNWKPEIDIDPDWKKIKLEDVCVKITDGSHNPPHENLGGGYFMLSSRNVFDGYITFNKAKEITEEDFKSEDRRTCIQKGDVLLTIVGTIGRTAIVTDKLPHRITLQRSVAVLKVNKDLLVPEFLNFMLRTEKLQDELIKKSAGVAQKGIYLKQLGAIQIPLPSLELQKEIIERIESESVLVQSANKLIDVYEQKIKDVIDNLWSN